MAGGSMRIENRMKRFRREKGFTQEKLAAHWGVTVRSIGRWERGEGRPPEWMRREMTLAANPLEWPALGALRALVESQNGPAMMFDDKLKVLAASQFHRDWGLKHYGIDVVGVDWTRYMDAHALNVLDEQGGYMRMIQNGLMCMRGIYRDPGGSQDGGIPLQLYADMTVVRVPDYGAISIAVGHPARADDDQDLFAPHYLD
jgi:DNA-binding XRE family transcriptional regulator